MIAFSKKITYAFEAIIYIAMHHSHSPISGKKLADMQGLPPRYLEIIMQQMVHSGILRSIRGPRGGYILSVERRKITADDIFTLIQKSDAENTITHHKNDSKINLMDGTILPYFQDIEKSMRNEMKKTTLADLCDRAFKNKAKGSSSTHHDTTTNQTDSFII